ncbi:hypothetical protein E1218_26630 [Kribbella turkmenica]|uniref:Glycosyl hydrolase family 98 putative carbohydrate-binding module domain-containing protein n=1 Tax=Kribbella turkmenica TaxID=2530375 RepID=A0A4R4WG78_9ACTN|nr:NPCBM/NEW2 domain-containing protein [Kribbella turkmenica]TDD18128.1 hypothetical protein E1218_26630 [Kribbella turkmenica]
MPDDQAGVAPGPTVTTTTTVTVTPSASATGGVTTGTDTGTDTGTNTGTDNGIGTAGDSVADLRPITGRMDKGPFAIHAQEFGDGLYRNIGVCSRTISATWNLGRRYQRFSAVIGLTDKSPDATLKVKFTAYVTDGTSRTATEPVVLGKYQPHSLQVDLNQADALELEAVPITSKAVAGRGRCRVGRFPAVRRVISKAVAWSAPGGGRTCVVRPPGAMAQ